MQLKSVSVFIQNAIGQGGLGCLLDVQPDEAFALIRKLMEEGFTDLQGQPHKGDELRFVLVSEVTSLARVGLLPGIIGQPEPQTTVVFPH